MKKINSNIYKLIAVAVVAAGTFSGAATTASAKTNKDVKAAKLIKKIKTKHYSEVRGKHGIIYSNYKLKKVISDLKKHKHINFKSNTKFVVKLANGKKATYRLIKHKHFNGVVLNRDVKIVKVKKATPHHFKSNSNSNATTSSSYANSTASSSSATEIATSSNATNNASSTSTSSSSSTSSSVSYTSYNTGSVSASSTTNSYANTNTTGTTTSSSNTNNSTSSYNSSSSDGKSSSVSNNNDSASNSSSSDDKSSAVSSNSNLASNSSSSEDKSSANSVDINSSSTQSSSDNNSAASNNSNSSNNSIFTSSEADQIKAYQSEAQSLIANNDTAIYAETPDVSDNFNTGKLTDTYVKNSVDWVNFFRKMSGLNEVTNDSQFNSDAQSGAAVINYVGSLTHSLTGISKPDYISDDAWTQADNILGTSNLSYNSIKPYENVTGFLNDSTNENKDGGPGHREWLLGNITKLGIGQVNQYGDYKYDGDILGNNTVTALFPAAKLFPIELLHNADWSVSVPANYNNAVTPTVTVHDNTDNKDVSVTKVKIGGNIVKTTTEGNSTSTSYTGSYGNFGTNIWFTPEQSAIQVNHSYTITVDGVPGYSEPFTYTTKLFSLGTPTA